MLQGGAAGGQVDAGTLQGAISGAGGDIVPGHLVQAGGVLEHLAVGGLVILHAVSVLVGEHKVPWALHVVLQVAAVPLQAAVDVAAAVLQDLPGALAVLPAPITAQYCGG